MSSLGGSHTLLPAGEAFPISTANRGRSGESWMQAVSRKADEVVCRPTYLKSSPLSLGSFTAIWDESHLACLGSVSQ